MPVHRPPECEVVVCILLPLYIPRPGNYRREKYDATLSQCKHLTLLGRFEKRRLVWQLHVSPVAICHVFLFVEKGESARRGVAGPLVNSLGRELYGHHI